MAGQVVARSKWIGEVSVPPIRDDGKIFGDQSPTASRSVRACSEGYMEWLRPAGRPRQENVGRRDVAGSLRHVRLLHLRLGLAIGQ